MTSRMLQIRNGDYGRVAIINLAGPITEHAHSGSHLQFWLSGDASTMKVGEYHVLRDRFTAVAVNAFEPHGIADDPPYKDCICMLFHLNQDWVTDRCRQLDVAPRFDFSAIPVNRSLRSAIDRLAARLTIKSHEVDFHAETGEIFDMVILAMKVCAANVAKSERQHFYTDFRIRKSVEFMHKNLDVRLSFDEVARASGLSRTNFFHLFRMHMNMTPSVFWNTIRMEAAIDRLERTDTSMTDLSYNLGFTDPGNYTRFFRSHSGISPSHYRKVALESFHLR